jgi:hypothetical protein
MVGRAAADPSLLAAARAYVLIGLAVVILFAVACLVAAYWQRAEARRLTGVYVHAARADGTRLCGADRGVRTVAWSPGRITCPVCAVECGREVDPNHE